MKQSVLNDILWWICLLAVVFLIYSAVAETVNMPDYPETELR